MSIFVRNASIQKLTVSSATFFQKKRIHDEEVFVVRLSPTPLLYFLTR